jgi:NhaA family Na+:H+ antiporter
MHVRLVEALDEPVLGIGWPVSLATDLALSYFVARIIFRSHPVIAFLLLLGIASDALGFLALALFIPRRPSPYDGAAPRRCDRRRRPSTLAGQNLLAVSSRFGGLSCAPLFDGVPSARARSHLPFLPHAAHVQGSSSTHRLMPGALNQFEIWWKSAQVALFFFGLVNAGVPVGALELGTWGLPIAVIVGKPLGVLIGSGVARLAGLHLPQGVGWRELTVIGFTAAMGFTVGLFFTTALLPPGQLRSETSMGVLLSLVGAPLALASARLLRVSIYSPMIQRTSLRDVLVPVGVRIAIHRQLEPQAHRWGPGPVK